MWLIKWNIVSKTFRIFLIILYFNLPFYLIQILIRTSIKFGVNKKKEKYIKGYYDKRNQNFGCICYYQKPLSVLYFPQTLRWKLTSQKQEMLHKTPNIYQGVKRKGKKKKVKCVTKKNKREMNWKSKKRRRNFGCDFCLPIFQRGLYQIKPPSCNGGSLYALSFLIIFSIPFINYAYNWS